MPNKRFISLIQIIVLLLGSLIMIVQPVRSYAAERQSPEGIQKNLQISFLSFIFPNRRERTRGSRKSSRAPFDESLPRVLSPRNTALLETEELLLQWSPVNGATGYTVEIYGKEVDWAVEVTGTEAVFNELESLVPNYRYTIVITTNEGISSKSGESVGFTLLPEVEDELVKARVEAIKAEQLEPDEEAIAIALEYFEFEYSDPAWKSYALNQAAIEILETRIEAGTEDSRVYLLQADTYLRIGLPLLARERYEQALIYAEATKQPELQAESNWGLGDVAEKLTEYEDALTYLQISQALYENLDNNIEAVEELQTRIDQLEAQF